jgi:hypothetical protein
MTLPRSARVALVVATLAAVPLAGCGGGGPATNGPFYGGSGRNWLCSPAESPDKVYTAGGVWAIRNAGPTAVIDNVRLTHLHGLRALDLYAVPGDELTGNWNGIPSPSELNPGVQWFRRQRADGARIPRTPHGQVVGLVLVVKLLGMTGSADGLDIYYHTSVGHYLLHISNGLALTTARKPGKCPP